MLCDHLSCLPCLSMLTIKQLVVLLILCGTTACNEDGYAPQTIGFDEEFEITLDEEVTVIDRVDSAADTLTVTLVSLQDNRCPEGVTCIRAEEAQIEVEISDGYQTRALPMCIGLDCGLLDPKFGNSTIRVKNDTASLTLSNENYLLILKDAIPYPKVDGKKSEQSDGADRAILKVIR